MPRPQKQIPDENGFLRIDSQVYGPYSRDHMDALTPLIARIDGAEVAYPRLQWRKPKGKGDLDLQAAARDRSRAARVWESALTIWYPLLSKRRVWFYVSLLLAVALPTSVAFFMDPRFPWNCLASTSYGLAIGLAGLQHLLGTGAGRRRTLLLVSNSFLQVGVGCAVVWVQSIHDRDSGVAAATAVMNSWKPGAAPEVEANRASLVAAAQKSMELELKHVLIAAQRAMAAQSPGEAKELIERAAAIAPYSKRYDVDNLAGYWQYQWGTMQRAVEYFRASTAFRPTTVAAERATLAAALASCPQSSDERQKHEAIDMLRATLESLPYKGDDWLLISNNLSAALLDLESGDPLSNADAALDCAIGACSCQRTSANKRTWYEACLNGANARAHLYFLNGDSIHLSAALNDCNALLGNPGVELEPGLMVVAQALVADLRLAVGDLNESEAGRLADAIESGLTASKITRNGDPATWARLQRSLACLYSRCSQVRDQDRICKARTCFQSAYTVWSPSTHPRSYAETKAAEIRMLLECDTNSPGRYLDEIVQSAYGALEAIAGQSLPGVEGDLCSSIAHALENPARKPGPDFAGALRMRGRARQCLLDSRNGTAAAKELSNILGTLRTMPQQELEVGLMEESLTAAEVALSSGVLNGTPIALANLMANLGGAHAMCPTGDRCLHLQRAKELLDAASKVFEAHRNSTACAGCIQLLKEVARDVAHFGCPDVQ